MVTSGYLNHIELGLNMKLNRNTKKWKETYNRMLIEIVALKGTKKISYGKPDRVYGFRRESFISAMPDRIKEAEEYADEIYKALR